MANIRSEDVVRVQVARTIRQHELERHARTEAVYREWDREIAQRVDVQLMKYMTRQPPALADEFRDTILKKDDPVKRSIHDHHSEEEFRRAADSIIQGNTPRGVQAQAAMYPPSESHGPATSRALTRPVLPVEQWGQQAHYASPYGHFTQSCEQANCGAGFHSARRLGDNKHMHDESDGRSAAGKTRTRFEKHCVGMLAGNLAREGEVAAYKNARGASSGAPGQDHYGFETGNAIIDAEFPVGRRCFPQLRGI